MQWDRLLWQSGFVVEYAQIGSSSWVSFRTVLARNIYLTQHLLPGGLGSMSSSHGYFSFQKVSKALNFHRWFQQSFIYFMQNEREMRVQAGQEIQLSHFSFPFGELFGFLISCLGFAKICHPRQNLTLGLRQ